MKYKPYTEAEIQSMHVMGEGIYPFTVLEVHTTDKLNKRMQDKNGNDLAKLKLMVIDNQSKERAIYTYISGDGAFAYKLRHFAKSIGLIEDYEQGIFDICKTIGKRGYAEVIIKKGTPKNDGSGELWPDRNDVKDFVNSKSEKTENASVESNHAAVPDHGLDNDVPF